MRKEKRWACDSFFAKLDRTALAVTFDEVLLKTRYSEILGADANLQSRFSRNTALEIPFVSSAMDTVTESAMAIAMAKLGGLGIIHKGMSAERQAAEVSRVKHHLSAFLCDPICVRANQTVAEVLEHVKKKCYQFLSFPVLNDSGKVVGIVTSSHFRFCTNRSLKIKDIMSKQVFSAPSGTTVHQAYKIMMERQIKILPMFSRGGKLKGVYTLADAERIVQGDSPDYNLSPDGTLLVGAAVGSGGSKNNWADLEERMSRLTQAGIKLVVIDTAHGDSKFVFDALKWCKNHYPTIDFVVGNVSEGYSAKRLVKAGADGIRVGQGPGSICTTRVVAGVGCPQITAVYECAKAIRGSGIPICADGGIDYSGAIPKALGAGADSVMLGKLLAGTTETPGDVVYVNGQKMKDYRGMGSMAAMVASRAARDRYGQADQNKDKLVPEGVEGRVPFTGPVSETIYQLIGGVRSGMGYCGARTISELQQKADFRRISGAGLTESHPHGLSMIKEAPNYRVP